MMATTTRPKQTAANNAFLIRCKAKFNTPTFRHVSALTNAEGEDAARAYLLRYVVKTLDF